MTMTGPNDMLHDTCYFILRSKTVFHGLKILKTNPFYHTGVVFALASIVVSEPLMRRCVSVRENKDKDKQRTLVLRGSGNRRTETG